MKEDISKEESSKNITKEVVFHRFNEDMYKELLKRCPKILVDNNTNGHYAGYLLGVQHVLSIIREGFKIQ